MLDNTNITQIKSEFDDFKLMNEATVQVKVDFSTPAMLKDYASELMNEVDRITRGAAFRPYDSWDDEIMEKYLLTLVWLHIHGRTHRLAQDYKSYLRTYAVPVLMAQLLLNIGRVVDSDYAIEFIPTCTLEATAILSVDEMREISNGLSNLENQGMKLTYGLPKSCDGDLDFMALNHVEDVVCSYRRTHPVFGFYAAFFKQRELDDIVRGMTRVRYGCRSDYEARLSAVMRAISGVSR